MANKSKRKTCFVIAPIGDEGSAERKWSDMIMEHFITPAVTEMGYDTPERADHISRSGMITHQIIERILNDTLVVADLTYDNPNVYYELAVRHVPGLPVIHLMKDGQKPMFDVQGMRVVYVDDKLTLAKAAICAIKDQIKSLEENPKSLISPIQSTIAVLNLAKSSEPVAQALAIIMNRLDAIHARISTPSIHGFAGAPQYPNFTSAYDFTLVPHKLGGANMIYDETAFRKGLSDFLASEPKPIDPDLTDED